MLEVIKIPFASPTQVVNTQKHFYFEAAVVRSPKPLTISFFLNTKRITEPRQLIGGVTFTGVYDRFDIDTLDAVAATDQIGFLAWSDSNVRSNIPHPTEMQNNGGILAIEVEIFPIISDGNTDYGFYSPTKESDYISAPTLEQERIPDLYVFTGHHIRITTVYDATFLNSNGNVVLPVLWGNPEDVLLAQVWPYVKANTVRSDLIGQRASYSFPRLDYNLSEFNFIREYKGKLSATDPAYFQTWDLEIPPAARIILKPFPALPAKLRQGYFIRSKMETRKDFPWS